MSQTLRIHQFLERSESNGPGVRAVVWTQGCSLGCPGCFNPSTHAFGEGEEVSVIELFERIRNIDLIDGLSMLGGEPLQQRRGVLALLELIRAHTNLSSLLFTGFTLEEVGRMPEVERLFKTLDVLIAGRYDETKRLARGLRGSTNKTVTFFTDRYSQADIDGVAECEVIITEEGEAIITGIDPIIPS